MELSTMSVHALSERVEELEQQLAAEEAEANKSFVEKLELADLLVAKDEALQDALHFLTQIDPVRWPSRQEARKIITTIRNALASPAAEPTPCGHVWVPYSEEARHVEFEMCAKCPEIRRAQPAPATEAVDESAETYTDLDGTIHHYCDQCGSWVGEVQEEREVPRTGSYEALCSKCRPAPAAQSELLSEISDLLAAAHGGSPVEHLKQRIEYLWSMAIGKVPITKPASFCANHGWTECPYCKDGMSIAQSQEGEQ